LIDLPTCAVFPHAPPAAVGTAIGGPIFVLNWNNTARALYKGAGVQVYESRAPFDF
jgi:hypothetical protein